MAPAADIDLFSIPPISRLTATAWAAKASLASIRSKSLTESPAFFKAFLEAGIGPVPIIEGSTPAVDYFGYPAVCKSCEVFDALNIQDEDTRCPECGDAVVFYNDPSMNLRRENIPFRVTDRFASEHHDKYLLNHLFKCPDCGKYTMKFEWVGMWD